MRPGDASSAASSHGRILAQAYIRRLILMNLGEARCPWDEFSARHAFDEDARQLFLCFDPAMASSRADPFEDQTRLRLWLRRLSAAGQRGADRRAYQRRHPWWRRCAKSAPR